MNTDRVNVNLNTFQRFIVKLIGATPRIAEQFQREREILNTTCKFLSEHHTKVERALKAKLDQTYDQRNLLAIALAQLVPGSGWGRDNNESWSDDWRTVVYLHLPRGQVTFHMHPRQSALAIGNLPQYEGAWDKTWWDEHQPALTGLIEVLGDDLLRKEARHG